jgi:hypothetical protein
MKRVLLIAQPSTDLWRGSAGVGAVCIELVELSRLARRIVLGDSIEGMSVRVGSERCTRAGRGRFGRDCGSEATGEAVV